MALLNKEQKSLTLKKDCKGENQRNQNWFFEKIKTIENKTRKNNYEKRKKTNYQYQEWNRGHLCRAD